MCVCFRNTDGDEITGLVNGCKAPSLSASLVFRWQTNLVNWLRLTSRLNVFRFIAFTSQVRFYIDQIMDRKYQECWESKGNSYYWLSLQRSEVGIVELNLDWSSSSFISSALPPSSPVFFSSSVGSHHLIPHPSSEGLGSGDWWVVSLDCFSAMKSSKGFNCGNDVALNTP